MHLNKWDVVCDSVVQRGHSSDVSASTMLRCRMEHGSELGMGRCSRECDFIVIHVVGWCSVCNFVIL